MTTPPSAAVPAQPATILRERLSRIHDACMGLQPKQAVGEMIAAMIAMPEWAALAAQGAAERAVPPERINEIADGIFDHQRLGQKIPALDRDGFRELIGSAIDQFAAAPAHVQTPAQTEHVAADVSKNGLKSNMTGGAYAPLPNFDDGEEPIWNAIFNWKTAERGADALQKAMKVESAIADQLRAYADATHALRASHAQAPAGAAAQMSAEAVRALPAEARAYIHQLEANTDPAGMVRENMQLCDTNAGLQAMYRKAADALKEVIGCFGAASDEGLAEALAETADERLKDLLERRLMYALYAAQEAVAEPTTAQAAPAAGAVAGPDLQPLHNLLYLAQRQTSLGAIQRVVGEARLELAKVREAAPTPAAQADSGVQEDAARRRGLSSLSVWWAMHEAQWELCGNVVPDDAVILSFMGSGASTQVTAGDLRAALAAKGQKP